LEQRINFYLFKIQFNEQIEALIETSLFLSNASEELQSSQQFAKILKWIYTIGSLLNKETRLSDAAGFSLDSLPKIIETKTSKGNICFIDFLVSKIEKKNPEILYFNENLPHLERASKVSLDILQKNKKEIGNEIAELCREIDIYERTVYPFSPNDKFLETMKPFLVLAEEKITQVNNIVTHSISLFNSTVEYFGDDPKVSNPGVFFSNIITFVHAFRRSHRKLKETSS